MKKTKLQLLAAGLLLGGILLIVFSERAGTYTLDGLLLCATKIIPSLFPYMVISSLLVYSGLAERLGRIIPVASAFNLPREAGAPLILGAVCGFPVGAKTAVDLFKNGCISKTQSEVLISISNNTGPSFVVGVVGALFWGSPGFGWALYFFQLLAAAAAGGIVNRLLFPFRNSGLSGKVSRPARPFSLLFSTAVSEAAASCLSICGFVAFFYVVIRFITDALTVVSAGPLPSALIAACLEFSTGTALSADLGGWAGAFLCGFSVGWAGLSVFFQAGAFALPAGLSLKRTVAVKSLQGIFTGALSAVYVSVFPVAPARLSVDAISIAESAGGAVLLFCVLLLLAVFAKPKRKS